MGLYIIQKSQRFKYYQCNFGVLKQIATRYIRDEGKQNTIAGTRIHISRTKRFWTTKEELDRLPTLRGFRHNKLSLILHNL